MSLERMRESIAKDIASMIESEIKSRGMGEITFTMKGLLDITRKYKHDYTERQICSSILSMERSGHLSDRFIRSGMEGKAIVYKYKIPFYTPKQQQQEEKKEVVEEKVEEPAFNKVKRLAQLGHEVEGLREIIIETYKLVRDLHDELKPNKR